MKILLVEDEARLADSIRRGLAEHGYLVEVAANGIDGLHLAREESFDLLLMDVGLPVLDGFDLLHAIRRTRDVPVLMLSARDRVEERVRALQDGADDYLTKPFVFSELVARIQALLRRSSGSDNFLASGTMTLADLEVDERRRRATRRGEKLELTAKEFSLLSLLLRNQGQVLSRTSLAEEVWDMNFESDSNAIEVAVRRLRRKLDDPFERKLLHTVRGMGYVLEDRQP